MSAQTAPLRRRGTAQRALREGLQTSAASLSGMLTTGPGPATARALRAGDPARTTAPTAEPRRPHLHAVQAGPVHRAAHRTAKVLAGMVATVVLAVGVLGIVALNALAADASFEAQALERDISELTLRHDDLVAAVAQLESPNRVRDVAIGQLGLMEPEVPGFLTIDEADMPRLAPKPTIRLGE